MALNIATGLAALRVFSRQSASQVTRTFTTGSALRNKDFDDTSSEQPKPTYVYQSPGSSMKEPGYGTGHSLSNPKDEYDPKPRASLSDPAPNMQGSTPASKRGSNTATNADTSGEAQPTLKQASAALSNAKRNAAKPEVYVYQSPGSSMRDASYGFSVKDPVYVVDPKPSKSGNQANNNSSKQQQTVVSPPPPNKRRVGLSQDDLAQQTYVSSAKGSMREPRYVSVSDPLDHGK